MKNSSIHKSHIIMFHDISDYVTDSPYSCTFQHFIDVIQWHIDNGYKFVSVDNIKNYQYDKICILTFDDGYKSVLKVARDYLSDRNIPLCVYISSAFLMQDGYLNEQELLELSKLNGVTIGSHSFSHKMTRYMSVEDIRYDVLKDINNIKRIISRDVKHFAFPFGSLYASSYYDSFVIKKMGFKTISYTFKRPLMCFDFVFPFFLPRLDGSSRNIFDLLER